MNDKLRETVQNFLVDWNNTSMDEGFGLADYDLWMETAINLLQQCVVDDYKVIPQDQEEWHYTKPIVGIDDKGHPIMVDSWDNKVKRSINNEKENY